MKLNRTLRHVGSALENTGRVEAKLPYTKSWALVIGISDYGNRYASLPNARRDAEAFCELLRRFYSFDDVQALYDLEATHEAILSWLRDKITSCTDNDDRVVFYFAGHGITQQSPAGALRGYLIPVDAKPKQYADFIDMEELRKACGWMKAKHAFIILDCCFSGVAASCARSEPSTPPNNLDDAYLAQITRRKAWQILTAGASDELVSDQGANPEHSPFTGLLLRGLKGEADENCDQLITATELATWVRPLVVRETSRIGVLGQSPFFNYFAGSEQGDFVFRLPGKTSFIPKKESGKPSVPVISKPNHGDNKLLLLLLVATLVFGYIGSLLIVGYLVCATLYYCGEFAHSLAWLVCVALWLIGGGASIAWWRKH